MEPIVRSQGLNSSEAFLLDLADETFLRLWSYPNVFVGKPRARGIKPLELCDLLVICGNDIIVFSDKDVSWPQCETIEASWSRWYRKSVRDSAEQLKKASRLLEHFAEHLYLDPKCTRPVPIEIPDFKSARIHSILIASGANDKCKEHYPGSTGSMIVQSEIQDEQHEGSKALPFVIGDVNSTGPFLHVFDNHILPLLLHELNTVTDFVRYVISRERLLRSGKNVFAAGEEDLLAYYLQTEDVDRNHDFLDDTRNHIKDHDAILIQEGTWFQYAAMGEYKRKKAEEEVSYAWDALIDEFVKNIVAGTSVPMLGEELSTKNAEKAVRVMALEDRMGRRGLAASLKGIIQKTVLGRMDRNVRMSFSGPDPNVSERAYIFVVLAYPSETLIKIDYERYRKVRINTAEAYCLSVLQKYRNLREVIAIGLDAPSLLTNRIGGSEDLMVVQQMEWSQEAIDRVEQRRKDLDILSEDRMEMGRMQFDEYPQAEYGQTRQQRRAAERKRQKDQRRKR